MLSDSAAKLFDVLIVWKIDRFGRNRNEIAINKVKLKKNGVKVLYAKENIPDGPEGILLESLLEGMAEYYIYDLVEKTTRGMKGVALKCRHTGGKPLLGYKVNPDKTYAIDELNASTVRLIFDMYARGHSYSEIIDRLNLEGRKTSSGKTFGKNSLHDLLINERYIGTYTFNKVRRDDMGRRNSHIKHNDEDTVRIEGGIPAIIDRETWGTVKKRMEQNKRKTGKYKAKINYLLTGKLFCGHCGGAMVGQSSGKDHTYGYYECSSKKRLRTCDKKNVKKEVIEQKVLQYTINYVLADDTIKEIATSVSEYAAQKSGNKSAIHELKKLLDDNQNKIDNVMSAIMQGILTESTKDALTSLEDERRALQVRIAKEELLDQKLITPEMVEYQLKKFKHGNIRDEQYCKRLIDTFVSAVFVYDDYLIITYNWDSSDDVRVALSDLEGVAPPAPNKEP